MSNKYKRYMAPSTDLEALYTHIDPHFSTGLGLGGKILLLIKGWRDICTVNGLLGMADTIMKMLLLVSVMGILMIILMGLIIPGTVYL